MLKLTKRKIEIVQCVEFQHFRQEVKQTEVTMIEEIQIQVI